MILGHTILSEAGANTIMLVLGEGAFGLVCKGTMSGPKGMAVRVAIKQLKTNAVDEEKEEFLREMDIMKQV